MNSWLDTETKAILQKTPPHKLAPPKIKGYTLVLLSIYRRHPERLIRAIQRIRPDTREEAMDRLNQKLPTALKHGLTESDALLGQFELICCDAISVFITDDVIKYGESDYLIDLYNTLLYSDEFAATNVVVDSIPENESGKEFVDQFLGSLDESVSNVTVPYKKARIMVHWGFKIGAKISLDTKTPD